MARFAQAKHTTARDRSAIVSFGSTSMLRWRTPGRGNAPMRPDGSRPDAGGPPRSRPVAARPQPIGCSIETGGVENHFGPDSVMWKQSSSRTPKLPGI